MKSGTYAYQGEYARELLARGRSEGRTEGHTEGRTEAKAAGVLMVLEARGLEVTDDAGARIAGCVDLDQLDLWLRRAATASSVSELFD